MNLKLIFIILFCNFSVRGSIFSIKATSPELNVDSLEVWLERNPTINDDRLINLIKVERSYYWVNSFRQGKYLPELLRYKEIGLGGDEFKATVLHIQGFVAYHSNENAKSFSYIKESYDLFERLNNNYGKLLNACVFIMLPFDKTGENLSKSSTGLQRYISQVEKASQQTNDLHAYIFSNRALLIYNLSNNLLKIDSSFEIKVKKIINKINQNDEIHYGNFLIRIFLSISYYFQKDYKNSYLNNKRIYASLKEQQISERSNTLYNLGIDCIRLNRNLEGFKYNELALQILYKNNVKNFRILKGIYVNQMFLADALGRHHLLLAYTDSVLTYYKKDMDLVQANNLQQLQEQYENKKKEQQIEELKTQQQRFVIGFLVILLFVSIIIFLGYKIVKTNQSLRKLVSLRDDFIRTIAHDLRRPMHAFTGLSETFSRLLSKGDEESIQKIAQSIDSSGLAVRQTLDNLLYWALSERNSLGVQKIDFCLVTQLKSVISLFSGVSSINNQRIQFKGPDQLIVNSDPNAISLIVRNLLDNATKFTPAGGIIKIEVFVIDSFVSIQIFNSGKGMEISQLNEIKTLLNQKTISRNFQKIHGLGLTMVQLHAKMLNIKINVSSSSENQGTIFCIEGITKVNND